MRPPGARTGWASLTSRNMIVRSLRSPEPVTCLRCGAEVPMRFRGPCPACADELRTKYRSEGRVVESEAFEPAMHVTPNAVALKDD